MIKAGLLVTTSVMCRREPSVNLANLLAFGHSLAAIELKLGDARINRRKLCCLTVDGPDLHGLPRLPVRRLSCWCFPLCPHDAYSTCSEQLAHLGGYQRRPEGSGGAAAQVSR